MVNKSKNLGTAAESAVVRYLVVNGFPYAERRALHGIHDLGDVTGTPGICIEIKAGEVAKGMAPGLVIEWLHETETERVRSKSDIGLLVMQRRGFGITRVANWWTVVKSSVCFDSRYDPGAFVMLPLGDAVVMLRRMGYGQSNVSQL